MENEKGKKIERSGSKIDPSFKSKRYRDKLRTEIKGLESLLPVDRTILHRKLDSQTVFRLVISFLRIKLLFKALGFDTEDDVSTRPLDADTTTDSKQDPEHYFKDKNIFQILDGFLLVATTDGTLVYASDNVLQYLGFNQVDLMHRCIYGLVHHDDHYTLKSIMEQTITTLESENSSSAKGGFHAETISFICRMKCFNGTSAGYLKIHCSGKVEKIPHLNLKTNKGTPNVLLLYCQPFMLTGNDITHDVKQNVFWSKHDMDLTIRELDKKTFEQIGYGSEELNNTTLYKYVHPEDLVTFAACHRMLMESTDVQTMYFRMESRDGAWIWLHSRGKVISKNSKKFSIVFTHCPVREEDSTFLQQETSLRRRYAINDLQYFVQNGQYTIPLPRGEGDIPSEDIHGMQKISNFCSPHMGFTEDVSLTFYSPLATCPSSWHALSDRHSPVLPSTHVAHKITQREKQLQFQEFKRRQQLENHGQIQDHLPYTSYTDHRLQGIMPIAHTEYSQLLPTYIKSEPPDTYGGDHCLESNVPTQSCDYYSIPSVEQYPMTYNTLHSVVQPMHPVPFYNQCQHQPLCNNFPPTPPVSPMKYQHYPCQNLYQPSPQMYHFHPQIPDDSKSHFCHQTAMQSTTGVVPPMFSHNTMCQHVSEQRQSQRRNPTGSLKPKNIQVSLHCESPSNNKKPREQSANHIQVTTSLSGQSCAVATNYCPGDRIEYDIEASIHMKIVENPHRKSCLDKEDLDLPSIGSFLEYLNE